MSILEYEIINGVLKVSKDDENQFAVYKITDEMLSDESIKGVYTGYLRLLAQEQDIEYAQAYIKQMFFGEDTTLIDGALINGAIQLLVKCYANPSGKGRAGLNPQKVFQTYATKIGVKSYLNQYNQFREARNTNLAHDQSGYMENIVGLTVDRKKCVPVEVTCVKIRTGYLYKQNAKIIEEMLQITLKYIGEKKNEKEKILLQYLKNVM